MKVTIEFDPTGEHGLDDYHDKLISGILALAAKIRELDEKDSRSYFEGDHEYKTLELQSFGWLFADTAREMILNHQEEYGEDSDDMSGKEFLALVTRVVEDSNALCGALEF